MSSHRIFEQSITIQAPPTVVEHCITDLTLMHQWLNPRLRCEPLGTWTTDVGNRSRFTIQLPLWHPSLISTVVERGPGLIVWQFEGFFDGQDRWQCHLGAEGTLLINRFEFKIPNPWVEFGFTRFAATWTQRDMQAQLQRLKQVAEDHCQEDQSQQDG